MVQILHLNDGLGYYFMTIHEPLAPVDLDGNGLVPLAAGQGFDLGAAFRRLLRQGNGTCSKKHQGGY